MANLPWRVSVRLMALAKKVAMVIGIIVVVLLAVRVYLSQQGPALHLWHTWRADEMSVSELDKANFADYLDREKAIFTDLESDRPPAAPDDLEAPYDDVDEDDPDVYDDRD